MKKLLLKLAFLFALIVVSVALIILLPPRQNSYSLAFLDKHQRLADTTAPRLVLVGGSNLAYGIDSEMLQNGLGITVVNTGLHAGFGLGRMLDDVAPLLQNGDTLVIAAEYSHFISTWNGESAAWELVFDARRYRLLVSDTFIEPEYQRFVDSWDAGAAPVSDTSSPFVGARLYDLPSDFPTYAANKLLALIRPTNSLTQTRDGFNEYGDYVKHLGAEAIPFTPAIPLGPLNPLYLARFFQFVASFEARGIRVVITYPSYEEVSFYKDVDGIRELDAVLRARESLTIISTPDDYRFPTNFFYDTRYHLNANGRAIRTKRLLRDLLESGLF
jgi:hypothetical protein